MMRKFTATTLIAALIGLLGLAVFQRVQAEAEPVVEMPVFPHSVTVRDLFP